jgi:hypothetical protein
VVGNTDFLGMKSGNDITLKFDSYNNYAIGDQQENDPTR